ncbi:sulfurtransferase TusA family protein [Neiella marina]|uniref:Sulfurtransferase TusA family protein n=2 Tax=Neiella holothuriorum TaxID=2870530 RepID=A0ABS7EIL8_9GAMM|nr:sulfurtransferase TusA family protein [Neiella holothuriorum]
MAFVKCKQALLTLEPGQSLEVRMKDPDSVKDILGWCRSQSIEANVLHTSHWISMAFLCHSN